MRVGIEEEAELHLGGQLPRGARDLLESTDESLGGRGGPPKVVDGLVESCDGFLARGVLADGRLAQGGELGDRDPAANWEIGGSERRGSEVAERHRVGRGLEGGRPRQERLEIALVAGDGGARGLGPDLHVGVDRIPTLGGQRSRHVHEGVRVESQVTDAAGPFRRPRRRLVERRGQDRAGLGEMTAGDRLGAPIVGEDARGFLDEEHRVPEPAESAGIQQGSIDRGAAGVAEGQQVRREVAAVDGGHVARLQRTERPPVSYQL